MDTKANVFYQSNWSENLNFEERIITVPGERQIFMKMKANELKRCVLMMHK